MNGYHNTRRDASPTETGPAQNDSVLAFDAQCANTVHRNASPIKTGPAQDSSALAFDAQCTYTAGEAPLGMNGRIYLAMYIYDGRWSSLRKVSPGMCGKNIPTTFKMDPGCPHPPTHLKVLRAFIWGAD